MANKHIVTRFAPSPTGLLHAGNYRTAVFAYLFARQNKGKFVLRIEDTDRERSKKEYEENVIESLKWLGLEYDEFSRQSEKVAGHKKHLQNLIEKGFAYISHEEKDGKPSDVIRFKNPGTKVTFKDLIRGEITMDTTDLHDFVIAKNLEEPVWHLAVVIDDFEMGITHVIRGEDHISNTPRQILIQRAIGAPEPIYAHLPLVLAPDRTKLSKRKGALAISEYRDRGYLPEALLNFMALLGWNPGGEQEIFSLKELVEKFNIEKIQKGGAIFNEEKLKWFNEEYMKRLPEKEIGARVSAEFEKAGKKFDPHTAKKILPLIVDRISTFGEAKEIAQSGEFDFFENQPEYEIEKVLAKKEPSKTKTAERLSEVSKLLAGVSEAEWNQAEIKNAVWDYATKEGRGEVLWPLRVCLSGLDKSPDPFIIAEILGKTETLERIKVAIEKLHA
ncbi:MAG: glutamate--tRNA ligase [Candidatus Pacebacteria bacterium]|nr:glutamate--tRNA ligase [Candidatus Paceibacterota bacterium]